MAQVTLEITAEDFEHFSFTSMEWAKNKFELQSDRFDPEAKYDWEMAYWCEMDYAAALMATAFLK